MGCVISKACKRRKEKKNLIKCSNCKGKGYVPYVNPNMYYYIN